MIPRAQLAGDSAWRRLSRWFAARLAPPRRLTESETFGAASYWSITGALAAGLGLGLYLMVASGALWGASLTVTVGWAIFATFGVIFLYWPFLLSYFMYLGASRWRVFAGRRGAAVYGALWHLAAHACVIRTIGGDPLSWVSVVPFAVGGLWGSWLPAASRLYRPARP